MITAKRKILFVAPFQISIRNLLSSGLASSCARELDAEIMFSSPYDVTEFMDDWGNTFNNYYIPSKIEKGGLQSPYGTSFLLRLICAVRMRMFAIDFPDGSFLMHTLSKAPKGEQYSNSKWLCWLLAKIVTTFFSRNGLVRRNACVLLEKYKPLHKEEYEIIKSICPDIVILSSNCVYWLDIRFQIEAKRKGIPVVSFVQSWDNLFSRGPIMRIPDVLLAWSDLMLKQAVTCHNFPQERIKVVGALQFIVYARTITNEECNSDLDIIGIKPDDEFFLYVPGAMTAEYDLEDFRAFYDIVYKSKYRDVKIVFRPHPQSSPGAYDSLKEFPVIFDRSPNISDASAGANSFDTKDMMHMACLLKRAKAVISSWATTVLLEAAILDRPVLQFRWMQAIHHNNREQLERVVMFQRYMHLIDFDNCNARRFCDSPDDLIADLDYIFEHNENYKRGRQCAVETFIKLPLDQCIDRTIGGLRELFVEKL